MSPRFASHLCSAALLLLLAAAPLPVLAVGGDEDEPAKTGATQAQYETAKRAIDAGRYGTAIPILEGLVRAEPRNANAWNLLAYSNRKLDNHDKALGFYRTALAIDPEHRGAHEYLGELYLAKGDLASAENIRARLSDICAGVCEELDDLDKAIGAYKAGRKPGSGS